jgi:YbbR domain-containing protein
MKTRWRDLLVAFLLAVVLWYSVTGSEKVESQMDVRVDYRGLPQGLVVRSGQVPRVTVRVRASIGMLRSLSGRDFAFFMDIADIRKGENLLAINPSSLPFRSGVEVIEIIPSRIILDVDTLDSKYVPLAADPATDGLPPDYITQFTFDPPEVQVTGPSTLLAGMEKIVLPLQVDNDAALGSTEFKRLLPLPDGVVSIPAEVKITQHIGIKRKLVTVTRTVQVDTPAAFGRFIRPDKVTLTLAVPASQAAKAASDSAIQAFASLGSQELGSYSLPVQAAVPENCELVSIVPPQVTVTLEQKQAPAPAPSSSSRRKK